MEEQKNIGQENRPDQLAAETASQQKAMEQTQAISKTKGITNPQSEIKAMETHAHELHKAPGHGWKHYFFEFFMLFLAVFCGFLAENLREHRAEREREKQYVASLLSDLKDDTLSITAHINDMKRSILFLDSLSMLVELPEVAKENGEALYYTSRMGIRQAPLANNNRTFDQLKNSSEFRVIRDTGAAERIMKYYSLYPELRMMEEIFNSENAEFKEVASKIMDQGIYRRQINADGSVLRITGNPSLLTYDPALLKQLGFYAVEMNGSRHGMIPQLQKLKQSAIELLNYLQKKYRLNE